MNIAFRCLQTVLGITNFSNAVKTSQEVITLVVFSIFSVVYLKEGMKWNYILGFLLMILAVVFIFKKG